MSTSPDELVNLLSHWLARHVDDETLAQGLRTAQEEDHLSPDQAEAVAELLDELERGESRGELERMARETLEALALG
jgi:hypothetical protein